jgi:hypothetical protein
VKLVVLVAFGISCTAYACRRRLALRQCRTAVRRYKFKGNVNYARLKFRRPLQIQKQRQNLWLLVFLRKL